MDNIIDVYTQEIARLRTLLMALHAEKIDILQEMSQIVHNHQRLQQEFTALNVYLHKEIETHQQTAHHLSLLWQSTHHR